MTGQLFTTCPVTHGGQRPDMSIFAPRAVLITAVSTEISLDRTSCPVLVRSCPVTDRTDNTPSLEGCLSGVRLNRLAKVVTK